MPKVASQNYLIGWLAIGAGLSGLVVALAWWSSPISQSLGRPTAQVEVSAERDNAFGNLGNHPTLRAAAAASKVTDQAGQGIAVPPADVKQYVFDFDGKLPTVNLPVLRRSTDLGQTAFAGSFRSTLTNLLDMNQFSKLSVQQIMLGKTADSSMTLTLDYLSGSISLYSNSVMPVDKRVMFSTNTSVAPDQPSTVTMPTDAEMTSLTDAYLAKYQISRDGFGSPVINKYWLDFAPGNPEVDTAPLLPSDVSVIYPWKINGHTVYDEGGMPYGLYVGVHLETREVNGFSNLVPMHFTASKYELTTDNDAILNAVHAGGIYNISSRIEGAQTEHVQASGPEVAYVISRYQLEQNQVEYLVPALRFTVETKDAAFYPKYIMVPLVKQILDAATVTAKDLPVSTPASPAIPD